MSANRVISGAIFSAARTYQLNPNLIAALIQAESEGDPWISRYEPGFFNRYIRDKAKGSLPGFVPAESHCTLATEKMQRSTSYGLMQIMGETAREHGFAGNSLLELCDPAVNIALGAKILHSFLDKELGDLTRALLRWNGGANASYPDRVMGILDAGEGQYLLVI
jgi:soluble lytic murein transglycosylase-like protein